MRTKYGTSTFVFRRRSWGRTKLGGTSVGARLEGKEEAGPRSGVSGSEGGDDGRQRGG